MSQEKTDILNAIKQSDILAGFIMPSYDALHIFRIFDMPICTFRR